MHIVTCLNCLDSNRTVALKNGVNEKKISFCKFSHKFSCNLTILLVQNIPVLNKPRKLVSCIRVDYENKRQMLFNPSIQFRIDAWGLLVIRRKGTHYAQPKFAADQSIPAVNIPPSSQPLGNFFRGQNPHARGRKMAAKPRPPGQNSSCAKSPEAPPRGKSRRQVLAERVLITQLFDK